MGKQINFEMDHNMTDKFWAFLKSIDNLEFIMRRENENQKLSELPSDYYTKIIIYNNEIGELQALSNSTTIDTMSSPVIEFSRTCIDRERKELRGGRLWVEMEYWDDNGKQIEKPKELDKLYQKLARWIRKNMPKIEIEVPHRGKVHKLMYYATPEIKRLVEEEGYVFR